MLWFCHDCRQEHPHEVQHEREEACNFFNMGVFKVSCASVMHLGLCYRFAMIAEKNISMKLNMEEMKLDFF